MRGVMRRPVSVLALLAVFLAPAIALPRTVVACSAGEDWDAVAESDVIIAGRVADMRLAPEYEGFGTPHTVGVWVDFEVDRYFKGTGATTLSALDAASVTFMDDQTPQQRAAFEGALYWGSGGACGALNGDPRGQYWVTGLYLHEGVYQTNLILLFGTGAIGSGPDDPAVVERIEALEDRLGPGITPATTGHGLAPTTDRGVPLALGVVALAILGGARLATRERRGA